MTIYTKENMSVFHSHTARKETALALANLKAPRQWSWVAEGVFSSLINSKAGKKHNII